MVSSWTDFCNTRHDQFVQLSYEDLKKQFKNNKDFVLAEVILNDNLEQYKFFTKTYDDVEIYKKHLKTCLSNGSFELCKYITEKYNLDIFLGNDDDKENIIYNLLLKKDENVLSYLVNECKNIKEILFKSMVKITSEDENLFIYFYTRFGDFVNPKLIENIYTKTENIEIISHLITNNLKNTEEIYNKLLRLVTNETKFLRNESVRILLNNYEKLKDHDENVSKYEFLLMKCAETGNKKLLIFIFTEYNINPFFNNFILGTLAVKNRKHDIYDILVNSVYHKIGDICDICYESSPEFVICSNRCSFGTCLICRKEIKSCPQCNGDIIFPRN